MGARAGRNGRSRRCEAGKAASLRPVLSKGAGRRSGLRRPCELQLLLRRTGDRCGERTAAVYAPSGCTLHTGQFCPCAALRGNGNAEAGHGYPGGGGRCAAGYAAGPRRAVQDSGGGAEAAGGRAGRACGRDGNSGRGRPLGDGASGGLLRAPGRRPNAGRISG